MAIKNNLQKKMRIPKNIPKFTQIFADSHDRFKDLRSTDDFWFLAIGCRYNFEL